MKVLIILAVGLLIPPVLSIYSLGEVHGLSEFLRGGDKRLIRDQPHKTSYLRTATFCEGMDSLIQTLHLSEDEQIKYYAADAITTCLIGRPENQNAAGINPNFHETVIIYLRDEPKMAAELIWAATENNFINLSGFIEQNAIEELYRVIRYYEYSVAAMWASAALSRMASSYCGVGGPCTWKWDSNDRLRTTHEIEVDGLAARLQIMQLEGLWDQLLDQVCSSVAFEGLDGVVLPSKAIQSADVSSLVPWAMASLIKNLALRPSTHRWLESTVPCLCILSKSDDPLERRNAWESLYHLGRDGACHTKDAKVNVCIDMPFETNEGYKCAGVAEKCNMADRSGLSSGEACCACGGGDHFNNVFLQTGTEDL